MKKTAKKIQAEDLIRELKWAESASRKIIFRFKGEEYELAALDRKEKELFIDLRKKPENKYGKCNSCKKHKYLIFSKCGKCWDKQNKETAIANANAQTQEEIFFCPKGL